MYCDWNKININKIILIYNSNSVLCISACMHYVCWHHSSNIKVVLKLICANVFLAFADLLWICGVMQFSLMFCCCEFWKCLQETVSTWWGLAKIYRAEKDLYNFLYVDWSVLLIWLIDWMAGEELSSFIATLMSSAKWKVPQTFVDEEYFCILLLSRVLVANVITVFSMLKRMALWCTLIFKLWYFPSIYNLSLVTESLIRIYYLFLRCL